MSPSAAELLRELFELFHRGGGVEAALPLLADDVVAVSRRRCPRRLP